jgi:hypothetical protein
VALCQRRELAFKIDGELVSVDRAQEILLKVADEARKPAAAESAGPYTVNAASRRPDRNSEVAQRQLPAATSASRAAIADD